MRIWIRLSTERAQRELRVIKGRFAGTIQRAWRRARTTKAAPAPQSQRRRRSSVRTLLA